MLKSIGVFSVAFGLFATSGAAAQDDCRLAFLTDSQSTRVEILHKGTMRAPGKIAKLAAHLASLCDWEYTSTPIFPMEYIDKGYVAQFFKDDKQVAIISMLEDHMAFGSFRRSLTPDEYKRTKSFLRP